MPSPFPGMDPYLEHPAFWADFHDRFINTWCEAIADLLPPQYEASLGEKVYLIEQDPDTRTLIYPDVAMSRRKKAKAKKTKRGGGLLTLKPVIIPVIIPEGPRETYVEILHRPERSLVTVLELLSPANKEQPGRTEYLLKRNGLFHQKVHLVELDLLQGGIRPPLKKPWPAGDCFYLVSRWEERPNCQVFAWPLRESLPRLPVPLRAPDADIVVDLASAFATAYDRGRFQRRLRYGKRCPAPLDTEERTWAESMKVG